MKKIIFFSSVTFAFFFVSEVAYSANWKFVDISTADEGKRKIIFCDSESVSCSKNVVKVWVMLFFDVSDSIDQLSNYPRGIENENSIERLKNNYRYNVMLAGISLVDKKYEVLKTDYYAKGGESIKTVTAPPASDDPSNWEDYITPGTLIEQVYVFAKSKCLGGK